MCAYVNACKRDYSEFEALGFTRAEAEASRLLYAAASGLRTHASLLPQPIIISVVDPFADTAMDVVPSSTAAASRALLPQPLAW